MVMQAELNFSGPVVAPIATAEEVEWLVTLLKGRAAHNDESFIKDKGWTTAAKLEALACGTKDDRKIRAIARAAGSGIFSYPGSPGYKLWSDCTMEEINHGLAAMGSQIRDMTIRRALYERAYHAKWGGLS